MASGSVQIGHKGVARVIYLNLANLHINCECMGVRL